MTTKTFTLLFILCVCVTHTGYSKNASKIEQFTEIQTSPKESLEVDIYQDKPVYVETFKSLKLDDNVAGNKQIPKEQLLNFYAGISGGKTYYDNSGVFVEGIKAIGTRILNLIKEDHYVNVIIKNIATKELENIKQFKGEIDFQWLGSTYLGYYAGENGRIDFETMYSGVKITDSNSAKIFDESASIFTFLLNVYYNPSIQNTKFAPYIGLGIGPTLIRLKMIDEPSKEPSPLNVPWFAYQVKFGVDYAIIPEMKAFLGYRYFNIPVPVADAIATHNIEFGLLFNF